MVFAIDADRDTALLEQPYERSTREFPRSRVEDTWQTESADGFFDYLYAKFWPIKYDAMRTENSNFGLLSFRS